MPSIPILHYFILAVVLPLLLVIVVAAPAIMAQNKPNLSEVATARIAWSKQPGVNTYRLQIASDEQFRDVLFDKLIRGTDYVVNELPPGRYYWRVAQAEKQTGQFLKSMPFEVKLAKPTIVGGTSSVAPPADAKTGSDNKPKTRMAVPGWSVATGEIVRLMSMQLRPGATDFVAVNSEGTVYAIEGSRGVALWTAHFNISTASDERVRSHYNQFAPLLISSSKFSPRVVVAFDNGIRALDGSTGREVWNTRIAGRPKTGVAIETDGGGAQLCLIAEKADKLLVLDANTGQLESQMTLRDEAVGPPVLLASTAGRALLIPLQGGLIELRTLEGKSLRSFKVGSEVTTQPIVVKTARGLVLLIGLKSGLAAFDAASVQPLGRIAVGGDDYPTGSLTVADLEGNNTPEVVLTTNGGRVIAADVVDGKIKWSTDSGFQASMPAIADLDGDGRLDVIMPGKTSFAIGLSGASGSVIWESVDDSAMTSITRDKPRSLAVARVTDGRLIVASNDRFSAGLRAVEVAKSSAKSNP